MVFQPGQSGNPEGRAKLTEEDIDFKKACKERGLSSLENIDKIRNNPKHKDCLKANELILWYAYGKPIETIQGSGDINKPIIIEIFKTYLNGATDNKTNTTL